MTQPGKSRRPSILRRIMLMSWLVAFVTVCVFALFTIFHLSRTKEQEMEERSKALAQTIEKRISQSMAAREFSSVVEQCLDVLPEEADLRYILVHPWSGAPIVHYLDTNGQPRWSNDVAAFEMVKSARPGQNADLRAAPDASPGKVWHYNHSASAGLSSPGSISLGLSMQDYDDSLRAIYHNIATTGGIVLILGVAAAYSVARNIIHPLKALQNFASTVKGGALNARAREDAVGEIGDLAESMNRMVESLELSNLKLRDSMKNSASLREKEILLREIHHRVKNNMQILTSLLRLQTRHADSQELRDVLQESEARIRSMGLLHEKLYQSESVSRIDMHGYLRTLTGELMRVNTPCGTKREIKLNVHGVGMGLDTALPVGLITTELVTNCLKYAFTGRQEGIIYVSLGTSDDGKYQLIVWDDGIGMDPNFDISQATSLGMRLVKMLTEQLNGSLSFDCSQGTRITVNLCESQYEMRL